MCLSEKDKCAHLKEDGEAGGLQREKMQENQQKGREENEERMGENEGNSWEKKR